jgi:RNA polymerase sigma-70 factor (ECF subfamily)
MTLPHGRVEDEIDDFELLRASDAQQFGGVFQRYREAVYSTAYAIVRDRAAAEDVTQETFLRAFQARNEFRGDSRVGWWLTRVATNLALNRVTRSRETPAELPDVEDRGDLQAEVETHVKCEALRQAVAALPESLREPLVLFEYEGRSCHEIGERLGLTSPAVRVRLLRARRALATALNAWA